MLSKGYNCRNLWPRIEADASFLAAREENKVSIFWDHLIEYLTGHYLNETLETGNQLAVSDFERIARVMASESRFSRRVLSKQILQRLKIPPGTYRASLVPSLQEEVLYVLLVCPGDNGGDHAEYRKRRTQQLYLRCIAAKAAQPNKRIIVGIALDARRVGGSSEDFIYMDTSNWSDEDISKAEALRQEMSYFVQGKTKETRLDEREYPS